MHTLPSEMHDACAYMYVCTMRALTAAWLCAWELCEPTALREGLTTRSKIAQALRVTAQQRDTTRAAAVGGGGGGTAGPVVPPRDYSRRIYLLRLVIIDFSAPRKQNHVFTTFTCCYD